MKEEWLWCLIMQVFIKQKKVKLLMKKLGLVVFTITPYSPELNQIEHTFGILKSKISKRNFNGKTMMKIVKEEILCLNRK